MHIFKFVCYRYLSFVGPLLGPILAHFGLFWAPTWGPKFPEQIIQKTCLVFGYLLDQFCPNFGTISGVRIDLKRRPRMGPVFETTACAAKHNLGGEKWQAAGIIRIIHRKLKGGG